MDVKEAVKGKYGMAASRVRSGLDGASCADSSSQCCSNASPITSNLYDDAQTQELPEAAVLASLGCGNPTALAELTPGEIVLDLGSGGGIDVLLSARRVSPGGKAYGLDMTDEMLALARENQAKAAVENVEFLKGEIEAIPLPDDSVDVIISNCVINLSADKDRVLREAFRVLRPGGRFAVSDVVTKGDVPPKIRENMLLWVGCLAGDLEENEYRSKLADAGFENVSIQPTRIYRAEDAESFLAGKGIDVNALSSQVDGKFMSAFIRATKPDTHASANLNRSHNVKTIQVFDPALCCSSGVCGVDVDEALVSFSADVDWAKANGAQIERFNLAQQPLSFAENPAVKSFLERSGQDALPLILVDGEVALAGRYPRRAELARWANFAPSTAESEATESCCSDDGCC
ncbi:MAG: arsenite efflux transporter metallochaperone ArsD [Candidatus Baltobacteraceae bacterium]